MSVRGAVRESVKPRIAPFNSINNNNNNNIIIIIIVVVVVVVVGTDLLPPGVVPLEYTQNFVSHGYDSAVTWTDAYHVRGDHLNL